MPSDAIIARALADILLTSWLNVNEVLERASHLLGHRGAWLLPLVRRVFETYANGPRPPRLTIVDFLRTDEGFQAAFEEDELELVERLTAPLTMVAVGASSAWTLPVIHTPCELAGWLKIDLGILEWFADRRSLEFKQSPGRLRNYRYRPLAKRFGQIRLVEAPKPRLKDVQRRVLAGILDHIPTHAAAHGFRHGRSICSFAVPHIGQQVVLRMDLADFFPSIHGARVAALFRTAGYAESVANLLAGLCTNTTPHDVWDELAVLPTREQTNRLRRLYAQPHLPQGAPTSPALANLCAYRMDCRLTALAATAGAIYTRYADDLAFSGGSDFAAIPALHLHAAAVAMDEGFSVHHRKTRIMHQGVCQRLAGIVVNRHANVARADYDRLKAILTNSLRHGPQSQNRSQREDFRAHLLGKISFVEMVNPAHGQKLRALFDRIQW